jgi:hypothetical protein
MTYKTAAYSLAFGLSLALLTVQITFSQRLDQLSQQFQAAAITTITKN